MKIESHSNYNEADQIVVTLTVPSLRRHIADVIISDESLAEILISDEVLDLLPVVSSISLLAKTLSALDAATTADTEIPMLVDTSFEI